MAKLSILVATTDSKILKNTSFYQLPFHENFNAIIVNQKLNTAEDLSSSNAYITVINSNTKGISNSRNLALREADSDYVHFCDDDVSFESNYFDIIQTAVNQHPKVDFFRFKIRTPEGEDFKTYPSTEYELHTNTMLNRRKILFFSSIEIVGKLASIRQNQLEFNPVFGVGNEEFPMGEEALFLLDALEKGCNIRYIPKSIVRHPAISSGNKLGKPQLRVLGVLFEKVYGYFSPIFNAYYSLKKRKTLKENGISIAESRKILNQKSN